MSLLPPFKRRTCVDIRLRCISPPWRVVSWVIRFLCGEMRRPPEGFMSMSLCRLRICFFVTLMNCAGGVWGLMGGILFLLFAGFCNRFFWIDWLTRIRWKETWCCAWCVIWGWEGGLRCRAWEQAGVCGQCCLWAAGDEEWGCREISCRGFPWGRNLVLQTARPSFCLYSASCSSRRVLGSITWAPAGSSSGEEEPGTEEPPGSAGSFLPCEAGGIDS